MTTRLSKPVARGVYAPRHGDLVVTLTAEGIYYREKGRRTAFLIPHGVAFQRAVDLHIRQQRAEKKARRLKK